MRGLGAIHVRLMIRGQTFDSTQPFNIVQLLGHMQSRREHVVSSLKSVGSEDLPMQLHEVVIECQGGLGFNVHS